MEGVWRPKDGDWTPAPWEEILRAGKEPEARSGRRARTQTGPMGQCCTNWTGNGYTTGQDIV